MQISLPLDKMTIPEKISTMESLWDNLCQQAKKVPSPSWHGDVLAQREKELKKNKTSLLDWDDAKKDIRESLS